MTKLPLTAKSKFDIIYDRLVKSLRRQPSIRNNYITLKLIANNACLDNDFTASAIMISEAISAAQVDARQYYILIAKKPDGSYDHIFGDYDVDLVEQEIFECRDDSDYDDHTDFKIFTLADDNISYDTFMANLNSQFVQQQGV
mgnify:CR=1 FL=1